jgi:superfamily I DNA and RNA helicase
MKTNIEYRELEKELAAERRANSSLIATVEDMGRQNRTLREAISEQDRANVYLTSNDRQLRERLGAQAQTIDTLENRIEALDIRVAHLRKTLEITKISRDNWRNKAFGAEDRAEKWLQVAANYRNGLVAMADHAKGFDLTRAVAFGSMYLLPWLEKFTEILVEVKDESEKMING